METSWCGLRERALRILRKGKTVETVNDMLDAAQKKLIAERWDEAHERMLESVLAENEELRKVFEESPEKKELYKFKILDA